MKGPPDSAAIIEGGHNYCWAATLSDDQNKLHVELWVLKDDAWNTVSGSGFSLDRVSAQKLFPLLQAFLASTSEKLHAEVARLEKTLVAAYADVAASDPTAEAIVALIAGREEPR